MSWQADVMLEYPIDEALALVDKNYRGTVAAVKDLLKDLAFLREQITTTEVSMRAKLRTLAVMRLTLMLNTARAPPQTLPVYIIGTSGKSERRQPVPSEAPRGIT